MAILAHPDDESLGMGGAFARYAAEGVETFLLTATRGERGRFFTNEHRPSDDEVGRVRERELRAAARELGIRELALLGYRDAELDRVDPTEAVMRIAAHVRRVRPHVVITFDPFGAYGHPDHIAISQYAAAGVLAAADALFQTGGGAAPHRVAKFYYLVLGPGQWAAYQAAFKRLVSLVDGVEREPTPWPEWSITTRIDARSHGETVWRAAHCHETQLPGYQGLRELPPGQREVLWSTQTFYRVFSTVNGGRRPETDLFDGLR